MFYYVDCPVCNNDLSSHAKEENLECGSLCCPYCDSKLKLRFIENWDEDLGCTCGMFWFEKID